MFLSSNIQNTCNGAHVVSDTQTLTGHILLAPEYILGKDLHKDSRSSPEKL